MILMLGACVAPSVMDFHRATLDDQARQEEECPEGTLEVRDITPGGFRYADDPDARRYEVIACGRRSAYLCYRRAISEHMQAECRSLTRPHSGEEVHLGPFQVR
jgi:hypothetical protein